MKNSAQILSHLQHQPQFSKLSQYECIKSVQKLFPPHLQRMIRYGYVRNGVMFFVFTHPGAKQEFDIIAESIKAPLRAHMPSCCREIGFNDIKAFVTYKPLAPQTSAEKPLERYKERALGNFSNPVSDEKLHAIIESIRGMIHDRAD